GEITAHANVRMEWARYWSRIVRRFRVVLEGWPRSVFAPVDLGDLLTADLKLLLGQWDDNTIYFRRISQEEYTALYYERKRLVALGLVREEPPIQSRRDKGVRRVRLNPATQGRKHQVPIKSKPMIDSED
ncbi:hypothetical protein B0H21DRAFT_678621, partial [Amylocystis lapponica]